MVDHDYILAPPVVTVDFALEPVVNILASFRTFTELDYLSGVSQWIVNTYNLLTPEQRHRHELVLTSLSGVLFEGFPAQPHHHTFDSYLDDLAVQDPIYLRDSLYYSLANYYPKHYPNIPYTPLPPLNELLSSDGSVLSDYVKCFKSTAPSQWREVHALLKTPKVMQAVIVDHLRFMWTTYMKAEWTHVLPMLEESVSAFSRNSYREMTGLEAIRAVTGRDMSGKMDEQLEHVTHLRFIPSAHIGPYISKFPRGNTLLVIFGARLPRGAAVSSPDLSRAELLIRLNALADDTRLRILEMLTHESELCAQDIIERLGDLSQSSVSRHLSQLSATGYIVERRREQQKCYSLNTERAFDTIRALSNFLARS